MRTRKRVFVLILAVAASSITATALTIYLTPLKQLDLIAPQTRDIDPAAFWKAYNADPSKYLFIDVRDASQYAAGHAEGAVSIPVVNFYNERTQFPKHGKIIVLICGDGRLAAIGYGYLSYYGFTNLERITGGLQNWISEGLPVEGVGMPLTATSAPEGG